MSASGLAATAKLLHGAADNLNALLGAYSPDTTRPIALAVSGGSDSLALMHMAAESGRRVRVLTIDHQLRPEAAQEAKQVARRAKALGLAHQTLVWDTPKGGQAAARDARYRLLANAARQSGANVLLFGHTFDDVIETILMRKRRGTPRVQLPGPMPAAPCPVWPEGHGITILRPLLETRRQELRVFLNKRGVSWIDDPSNDQPAYERVRVRQFLKRHPLLAKVMADISSDLMALRQARDETLGRLLGDTARVQVSEAGLISADLSDLDTGLAVSALSVLLRVAGGHDRPPAPEPVADMLAALKTPGSRRTLAGAWVQKTEHGLIIGRDPGEVVHDIKDGIFDGRYIQDAAAQLPETLPFLIREARPPGPQWRSLIADRLALEARAYQTRRVSPVQI